MTPDPHESNGELVTLHSPYRTDGIQVARCDECNWGFESRSQASVTRAAKQHVDRNPQHVVYTQRSQIKRTWAKLTTVLR